MSTLTPITPHDPLGNARSPHWPRVRLRWLVDHPTCEACGRKQMLNVHHVAPFHLHPEKELDPANLVTLCEDGVGRANCHLLFGHCGNWKDFNRAVRLDAGHNFAMIANRVRHA